MYSAWLAAANACGQGAMPCNELAPVAGSSLSPFTAVRRLSCVLGVGQLGHHTVQHVHQVYPCDLLNHLSR
jgi:hypothetical protein